VKSGGQRGRSGDVGRDQMVRPGGGDAEKIAIPSAPPSQVEALTRAAASPALSGATPACAAVVKPTKTAPRPTDMISRPGSRSGV
jgi:hypothetical protein